MSSQQRNSSRVLSYRSRIGESGFVMTDGHAEVTWHRPTVERPRGCVVWFTGLSGSGKSTIANCVDAQLHELGVASFLLDGDNVRHGLNASPEQLEKVHGPEFAHRFGLGFSAQDREENIRRIAAVAEIFCSAGILALTAFVSPFRRDRDLARESIRRFGDENDFVEVYVDTPLEICEARDPKGLYKKARAGLIQNFTGISDPYEPPEHPELRIAGGEQSPEALAEQVIAYLRQIEKIPS